MPAFTHSTELCLLASQRLLQTCSSCRPAMTLMQVVYTGPTDRASAHFAGLGYTAPSITTSIADHMLDVVIKVALAVSLGSSLVTSFPAGCLLVKDYALQPLIYCTWALTPAASAHAQTSKLTCTSTPCQRSPCPAHLAPFFNTRRHRRPMFHGWWMPSEAARWQGRTNRPWQSCSLRQLCR